MKTLVDHLAQYAAYHRDRRNIFSHFIGIPMIVLSIAVLLARPALGFGLSPALLLALAAALFYLRLDLRFGVAMTALLALTVWGAAQLAAGTTAAWLGWASACSWSAGSSSSSVITTKGASRPSSTISAG